jgi:hypothetical protein
MYRSACWCRQARVIGNRTRGGRIGTVRQRYGDVSYAAFEVRLGKKQSELFWHHELEEAEELYQQYG